MPIPLKEKVKNYDNLLTGKLINFVENPDSLGYADGRWYSPKYDRRYKSGAFDPANFGIGIDRNSNEYVDNGELMFHKDSKGREYLTEAEERNVRNHSIANAEKSYAKRLSHAQETLHSNNIPSEIKKAITISAIYNLGPGYVANNLFEDNVLMNAFLNGTDLEYSNQVNRYYEKKRKGDRGIKTNRFIEQLQQEPATMPNTIQGGGIRAEGGSLNSHKLWDDLSMTERAEMMRVAVNNGITDLPTIRQKYNEFAEGGPKRDYNTWKKLIHDYKGIDVDNDNTYDYLSYYNNHTDEAWDMLNNNPDAHFYDTYKTAYHPTFSNESVYSGRYDLLHNPRGVVGGRWLENPNRFVPSLSKRDIDSIRETADYISVAEPNGLQIRDEYGRWPIINGTVFGGVLPQADISPKVYFNGGSIHIKPENRGKFTALKERTGHSATWFKQHGTPAQRKMATFALNARKWKHSLGGYLFEEGGPKPRITKSKQAPWYSELDEAVLGELMQEFRNIAHPRNIEHASYRTDVRGKKGGTAQRTYLLPRFEQEDIFLRDGYIKGREGDYGLVKKAVNNRNLPVWQTKPDAVSRETLVPIGNAYGMDSYGYINRDKDLVHAESHPTAFYVDGSTGKLYTKGWDLNDYGGTGGGQSSNYNILEKAVASILDFIGNPVVVTTGFQEVTNPWGGPSEHLNRGATIQDLFGYDDEGYPTISNLGKLLDTTMNKQGLHRENINGKWVYSLPEVTITGKRRKKVK